MSADFVLTIESDDEGQDASRLKPLNGNERAKIQNASSNASDKLSTAASKDKGKGKGKGKRKRGGDDDDGNDAAMDGRFTFDALGGATFDGFSIGGGSSSSSRKIPGQDWVSRPMTVEYFALRMTSLDIYQLTRLYASSLARFCHRTSTAR